MAKQDTILKTKQDTKQDTKLETKQETDPMDAKDPSSPAAGDDPVQAQAEPAGQPVRLQRGVIVVPFVIATGLTFLVLMGMGQEIQGTWILVPLIIGAVVAVSSLAWAASKRPHSTSAITRGSRRDGRYGQEGETGDPLAHIHVVESQARRHTRPCLNCGTPAGTGLERCPNCDHILLVDCKGCRTKVRLDWGACPECGRDLP